MICSFIFLLAGCDSENNIEDIEISQPHNTYSDDAILIKSHNNFQCIDTNIEYDEELGVYTCTVKFKKIIDK
jgi:hypothetical protein